jgi:hypothetical protein
MVWVSRASAKFERLSKDPFARALIIKARLLSDLEAGKGIISEKNEVRGNKVI